MHGLLKGFTVYYRAMREWEVGEVLNETTEGKGFTLTGLQPYQNYTLQGFKMLLEMGNNLASVSLSPFQQKTAP